MSREWARAGLAFSLVKFGLIFVVGMLLYVGLDPAVTQLLDAQAAQTETQAAAQGATWVEQAWDWLPLWVALLAVVMLLARAFVERRVGGVGR